MAAVVICEQEKRATHVGKHLIGGASLRDCVEFKRRTSPRPRVLSALDKRGESRVTRATGERPRPRSASYAAGERGARGCRVPGRRSRSPFPRYSLGKWFRVRSLAGWHAPGAPSIFNAGVALLAGAALEERGK